MFFFLSFFGRFLSKRVLTTILGQSGTYNPLSGSLAAPVGENHASDGHEESNGTLFMVTWYLAMLR